MLAIGTMNANEAGESREPVPDLSLVILCYRTNEYARDFAERAIRVLEEANLGTFELVLVGNYVEGTDDRTPDVVRELAANDPRILCVAEPKRGWMGWDMRTGFERARGSSIAIIDGDGQMPLTDVADLWHLLQREDLDLVKTFRITRGDGLRRRFVSNVYNKLFHLLFPGTAARDMNAKPKIFTREAYEKLDLESDDWFIDAEIMIQARRHRFRIGERPTGFLGLTGRRSFVKPRAVLEFVRNLVVHRIREFREGRGS